MNKNEKLTRRNRLAGFNYANPGYYLVTACTANRMQILGKVQGNQVLLSPVGRIVEDVLLHAMNQLQTISLGDYVIMPNHIHLLLYVSLENESHTVSTLMKSLKGITAAQIRREALLPPGSRTMWQKGFHDQIIRNNAHLDQVRRYVADNPRKWSEDEPQPRM